MANDQHVIITAFWDNWLVPKFSVSNKPTATISLNELLLSSELRFAPQLRDAELMGMLFGAKFCTTHQIARALWDGPNRLQIARRRLNQLYDFGFVAKMRPRSVPGSGTMPLIWTVTGKGVELLARSSNMLWERLQPRKFDRDSYLLPSQLTVIHSLIISELGSACMEAGGHWYFDREGYSVLSVSKTGRHGDDEYRYPDAVLEWPRHHDIYDTWYLEVERSAHLEQFIKKMDFWRRLRGKYAAANQLEGKKVIVLGRVKDTLSRDERSILPLCRLLDKDEELRDFVYFIPIPNEPRASFSMTPLSASTFLSTYDN